MWQYRTWRSDKQHTMILVWVELKEKFILYIKFTWVEWYAFESITKGWCIKSQLKHRHIGTQASRVCLSPFLIINAYAHMSLNILTAAVPRKRYLNFFRRIVFNGLFIQDIRCLISIAFERPHSVCMYIIVVFDCILERLQ